MIGTLSALNTLSISSFFVSTIDIFTSYNNNVNNALFFTHATCCKDVDTSTTCMRTELAVESSYASMIPLNLHDLENLRPAILNPIMPLTRNPILSQFRIVETLYTLGLFQLCLFLEDMKIFHCLSLNSDSGV